MWMSRVGGIYLKYIWNRKKDFLSFSFIYFSLIYIPFPSLSILYHPTPYPILFWSYIPLACTPTCTKNYNQETLKINNNLLGLFWNLLTFFLSSFLLYITTHQNDWLYIINRKPCPSNKEIESRNGKTKKEKGTRTPFLFFLFFSSGRHKNTNTPAQPSKSSNYSTLLGALLLFPFFFLLFSPIASLWWNKTRWE